MRFELFVAARYLKAKRRQAVVGVVTTISVAGVAAGVAALIIALAITNGMRRDLQDRLLGSTAHVHLMRVEADGIRDWQPLLERLRHLPHVTAAAPDSTNKCWWRAGPRRLRADRRRILRRTRRTVSDLLKTATPGSCRTLEPQTRRTPAHGQVPAAHRAGQRSGRSHWRQRGRFVLVTSPQGELTPMRDRPQVSCTSALAGIFHSGFYQYDSGMGLSAPGRCAAALQRARSALGDQLQGGRSGPRAGDRHRRLSRPRARAS